MTKDNKSSMDIEIEKPIFYFENNKYVCYCMLIISIDLLAKITFKAWLLGLY